MVKSTGAPASAAPIPDTARKAPAPEIASAISDVEGDFGASPAEADAKMNQTVAMREAALDGTEADLIMPTMGPAALREMLAGITVQLNALGRDRSPSVQAAE